ncbi:(2Fe-2S)-binding protein [Kineobactrum salinum]|uniref:(2Fe-2S)-binding protein n=1 Tax=Kineobactrum salinum TaxID=2708301 RepID=A0A6C0U2C2_9GAMM|nr:(2Fe-2S)-binding protein [Kineobactrum salinum]QIB65127.1 (2Fe-2S)-binding protein [Kineobactrum salinum]
MFKRRTKDKTVTIILDETPVEAGEGETIAAAILASSRPYTRRSLVAKSKRAPYCMMGVCFECLVEVDGIGYQQACMRQVRDGQIVRRHNVTQETHWS